MTLWQVADGAVLLEVPACACLSSTPEYLSVYKATLGNSLRSASHLGETSNMPPNYYTWEEIMILVVEFLNEERSLEVSPLLRPASNLQRQTKT
uniref:Uncharacterized protein n=1 Tax=Salix viminalis TaxID=40686 RepID=A0A6N2KRK3_SALVM